MMNWWSTTTTKIPAVYLEGDEAGEYNPADIRGSYTLGEISSLFQIPIKDLASAFGIPRDTDANTFELKDLETQFADAPQEIGTSSVRLFVAFYKGLPIDLVNENTYLLKKAGAILVEKGNMTTEQAAYLETHIIELNATDTPASSTKFVSEPTPLATEHVIVDGTISGKTTFQDLLDWGVTQEAIEEILGSSMPAPAVVIKDYATSQGIEFSTLKTTLQAEVDLINP